MSNYTDDDVTAGAGAIYGGRAYDRTGSRTEARALTRAVLSAVAPAIAARALREAADELASWSHRVLVPVQDMGAWLRARADLIEGGGDEWDGTPAGQDLR